MNRLKQHLQAYVVLTVLVALAMACASTGTGRPEVVKAEDVWVNSLTIWTSAMTYHQQNSRTESPATYKILEEARVDFPKAHRALGAAIQSYKKSPTDASPLRKAVAAVEAIIEGLKNSGVL